MKELLRRIIGFPDEWNGGMTNFCARLDKSILPLVARGDAEDVVNHLMISVQLVSPTSGLPM